MNPFRRNRRGTATRATVGLLAAVGVGEFKNVEEACAATIRVVDKTSCNRKAAQRYDRGFPVYQQLYQSLRRDFQAIAGL